MSATGVPAVGFSKASENDRQKSLIADPARHCVLWRSTVGERSHRTALRRTAPSSTAHHGKRVIVHLGEETDPTRGCSTPLKRKPVVQLEPNGWSLANLATPQEIAGAENARIALPSALLPSTTKSVAGSSFESSRLEEKSCCPGGMAIIGRPPPSGLPRRRGSPAWRLRWEPDQIISE